MNCTVCSDAVNAGMFYYHVTMERYTQCIGVFDPSSYTLDKHVAYNCIDLYILYISIVLLTCFSWYNAYMEFIFYYFHSHKDGIVHSVYSYRHKRDKRKYN